jgi:hypothetical protein
MRRLFSMLLIPTALLIAAGCDDSKPAKRTVKSRETIGKKTQKVLRLDDALKNGGVLASTSITGSDPLTIDAEAYRTTVGKIGSMAVEQAMRMYEAEHAEYPKNYDEFMTLIIKKDQPDGIQLAMLPFYQEYAYDEVNRKLVVVEFPAIKAKFQKEQDRELGR